MSFLYNLCSVDCTWYANYFPSVTAMSFFQVVFKEIRCVCMRAYLCGVTFII